MANLNVDRDLFDKSGVNDSLIKALQQIISLSGRENKNFNIIQTSLIEQQTKKLRQRLEVIENQISRYATPEELKKLPKKVSALLDNYVCLKNLKKKLGYKKNMVLYWVTIKSLLTNN